MKGMKGKFLKKLKSIRPIGALKQVRVLQFSTSDGFLESSIPDSNRVLSNQSLYREQQDWKANCSNLNELEPDAVDVSEFLRDLEDEEMEFGDDVSNKENIGPPKKAKDPSVPNMENLENSILSNSGSRNLCGADPLPMEENSGIPPSLESGICNLRQEPLSEIDVKSFRRPELNSGSLFDPNLLAAFEQAVMDHIRAQEAERKARIEEEKVDEEPPWKARRVEENPLSEFEEKCPPGGSESVILYTTSLRGIRKTFEDCNSIRFLLDSFRILFCERDVSMHLEFREEMWTILGGRVVPPRLFIRGRYIGGADEVVGLHEQGKLLELLQGVPRDQSTNPCDGCCGIRFVLCFNCNGSRKISPNEGEDVLFIQCPQCNENGLIVCPICC